MHTTFVDRREKIRRSAERLGFWYDREFVRCHCGSQYITTSDLDELFRPPLELPPCGYFSVGSITSHEGIIDQGVADAQYGACATSTAAIRKEERKAKRAAARRCKTREERKAAAAERKREHEARKREHEEKQRLEREALLAQIVVLGKCVKPTKEQAQKLRCLKDQIRESILDASELSLLARPHQVANLRDSFRIIRREGQPYYAWVEELRIVNIEKGGKLYPMINVRDIGRNSHVDKLILALDLLDTVYVYDAHRSAQTLENGAVGLTQYAPRGPWGW